MHRNLDGSHKASVLIQHDGAKYFDNTSLFRTKDTPSPFKFTSLLVWTPQHTICYTVVF